MQLFDEKWCLKKKTNYEINTHRMLMYSWKVYIQEGEYFRVIHDDPFNILIQITNKLHEIIQHALYITLVTT